MQVLPFYFLSTIKKWLKKKNLEVKGKIKNVDYLCISKIIQVACIICW